MGTEQRTSEQLQRERDAWEHSAAQFCRGMEYYRGLLDRIGSAIGKEAYTADDGSISDDVLRAKVPEIIERLLKATAVETTVQLHAQPGFAVFASAFDGRIRFENFTPHRLEVTVRIVPLLENPT